MNACRHHEQDPRSICPSCGAWLSAMDIASTVQKRLEERPTGGYWTVERDAAGKPLRMLWHV